LEQDRLNGLDSSPYRIEVDTEKLKIAEVVISDEQLDEEVHLDELKKIPGAPKKGQRGASKEYMKAIRKRRDEMSKVDPSRHGGRTKKPSRAEITERALERLEPMALRVLEVQLKSVDERVRQTAAIKILEWKRGKPGQTVQVNSDAVHTIKYETVAFGAAGLPPRHDIELLPGAVLEEDDDGDIDR
jgi:hypothetical protein